MYNNPEKHIVKPYRSDEANNGIDTAKILRLVRQYWYLYALSTATMLLLGWAFLNYQTPVYEIKSSILIKDDKTKQGISTADLLSKEFSLNANRKILTDETQIMTSYSILEEVAKDLKLDRSVYLPRFLSKIETYGEDCPIVIDSFKLTDVTKDFKASLEQLDDKSFQLTLDDGTKQVCSYGNTFSNTYGHFLIQKGTSLKYAKAKVLSIVCRSLENATKQTMKSVEIVLPKKESYIFEAVIKSSTPQKAKDILHKMVMVYNEQSLTDNSELSQSTLKFIEKRLSSLSGEMTGVEHKVESYKTKEGMTPDGTSDIGFLFNKLGEYDSELVKLGVQNDILSSLESVLVKDEVAFELLPTNLELKSSGLQNQITDYNKLVLERNRLARAAGDNNPNLKIIVEDLKNIRRAIIENISRVKQDNKTLLTQMESKNTQYTDKLSSSPRKERELLEIKRNQNIKEGLYLFLLQKQEEMGMSIVGVSANARVVDKPLVGDPPATTNQPFIYLFCTFLGLTLTSLSIGLKAINENTVQSEADISVQTGMPILAKIPFNTTKEDWVITTKSRTAVSEMFRLLRANLQFYLPKNNYENNGQVILVTSTISGEGKSFVTSNLAMSLAIADKKTVIIELDLRRPKMLDDSMSNDIKDVTDYINYNIHPSEIIQASEKHENLFFISSRPTTDNPSELIMNPKMSELLMYLREQFDYIIIDTPPVGIVSDALFLTPYTDMTLYVVRFGYTEKAQLRIINEFYEAHKLSKPTILFNGLKWDDRMKSKYGSPYYTQENNKIKVTA